MPWPICRGGRAGKKSGQESGDDDLLRGLKERQLKI
jgi:hypothetical protein